MSTITRTRTGCWTCRGRRVKCDETRPTCKRCLKGNLICGYGVRLIWHEESLSKGVCHGRSGVWSKKGSGEEHEPSGRQSQSAHVDHGSKPKTGPWTSRKRSRPTIFLNTTLRDVEQYFEYENRALDSDAGFQNPLQSQRIRPLVPILLQHVDCDEQRDGAEEMDVDVFPQLVSHLSPMTFRTLSYDASLLSYYEAVICSSTTLLDDAHNNPYRHLILPMALQSEPLYHAIMAVSAQTLRMSNPCYNVAALEHSQMALRSLTRALRSNQLSDSDMDEALTLVFLLCWFEITDASRPSWVTHLNGLRTLISGCQQMSKTFKSRNATLYNFFNRYFAFHLVLARTAFRIDDDVPFSSSGHAIQNGDSNTTADRDATPPTIGCRSRTPVFEELRRAVSFSKSTEFLSVNMSLDNLEQIDPYMGFSDSLLLLINEVADLAWQEPSSSHRSPDQAALLRARVHRLKESLENLRQTPPQLRTSGSTSNSLVDADDENDQFMYTYTVSEFAAIAEAYRLGALLLLYKIYPFKSGPLASGNDSMEIDSETDDMDLPDEQVPPEIGYVRGILSLMSKHLNRIKRTAALPLWPLFLAGCCATCEEDQITVMSMFEKLEEMKRFGNISPARKVVELVWRQRDLGVQDDRKRRKTAASNQNPSHDQHDNDVSQHRSSLQQQRFEWERAMAMLGGWKLSLT